MNEHQKLDTIAQSRIAAGAAKNNAANQGAIGSSADSGGQGSIQSQLSGNLGYLDEYKNLTNSAAEAESSANTFGDISSFAFKVFNNSDYIASKASNVFGS